MMSDECGMMNPGNAVPPLQAWERWHGVKNFVPRLNILPR